MANIVFTQHFSEPPTVNALPRTVDPAITLSIKEVTKDGCSILSTRKDGYSTLIHWSAIGK